MQRREKYHDISSSIDVSDYQVTCAAVISLYSDLYPDFDFSPLIQAYEDVHKLFTGHFPNYHFCDTIYHDLQHTLDMSLALARMIAGYERDNITQSGSFGGQRAMVATICAIFHDSGYIRSRKDTRHSNGAEYTKTHVTRSANFLSNYLPTLGLGDTIFITNKMVHFTGYELSIDHLNLQDKKYQMLGHMLGTADLIAQMSDRCYLEKCRDRLYNEFVLGGVDRVENKQGQHEILYRNPEELLRKTPEFYEHSALVRLDKHFDSVYQYAEKFFNGKNLYMLTAQSNIDYLKHVIAKDDFQLLRRKPLENMGTLAAKQKAS